MSLAAPPLVPDHLTEAHGGRHAGLAAHRLPRSLLEAIEAFRHDSLAKAVIGDTVHELYTRHKLGELRRFHERITPWEHAEYVPFL